MKKFRSVVCRNIPDDWMDDHQTYGVWNPTDDDSESDDSDNE